MNDETINHNEIDSRGRYFIDTPAGEAELTYALDDKRRMIINHTYVPIAARGGKVALRLVERAVADAKARGLKITPLCSYVARVFERRAEWASLRA